MAIEGTIGTFHCNIGAWNQVNVHCLDGLNISRFLSTIAPFFCVQVFCETVGEMAQRQFCLGSPLRTLHLLLAQQPAEVFAGKKMPAQGNSPMAGGPQPAPGVDQVKTYVTHYLVLLH